MIGQLVNYIGETALRHKAVRTFKYQSRVLINQQNNNSYMQFVIEDNMYLQQIITRNIFTATMNVDIIGFPKDDTEILSMQNDAMQVAVEVMAFIENDDMFMGQLSIHDYDILFISHFTDDDSAGVRLSLEIVLPNPVNLCEYEDNFEELSEVEEQSLDLSGAENSVSRTESKSLTLNPLKLKTRTRK